MQSAAQRSFARGELAPALHARADLAEYTVGLRTCQNWFVRKEGGVSNRSGLRYVDTVKNSAEAMLLRYESETVGGSVLIEMGNGYFRFFLNGAAVELTGVTAWSGATPYIVGDIARSGGVNYYCILAHTNQVPPNATYWYAMPAALLEIPHTFGAHQARWEQSGRVITLTHGEVPPAELIYVSVTTWIFHPITTGSWHAAPTTFSWAPGVPGPSGGHTYGYVVTAARAETYEETDPSTADIQAGVGEPTVLTPNVLTWDVVPGAVEYYVYCDPYANGVYGFVGTAASNSFNDIGFQPDFAVTPPIARVLFAAVNDYPDVSGFYQQRRVFANTATVPDQIDLSRTGVPANFSISAPLQDDDAIRFTLAGTRNHPVRWVLGLRDLIVGTSGGVWVVRGAQDGALTPNAIDAREQVYAGAHDRRPVVIGNTIVYLQARGKVIRDVSFDQQVSGLGGRDLTSLAAHLFEPTTFARLDYAETPHSIVWAVRNDGVLLGMTYLPDQDIWGWHRHETQNGLFEDVCVVPEAGEDVVYVIVKRTINSVVVRYIERLATRTILNFDEDCFFVDSGLTYAGLPANHISGLEHLEGQVVSVVGDGAVVFNGDPTAVNASAFTVTGGAITLDDDFEVVHVGLPIRFADLETLDLDVAGVSVRDKVKRVGSVTVLLADSARTIWAGPSTGDLQPYEPQVFDEIADTFTGQIRINLTSAFTPYGRVVIRVTDPLPVTILGLLPMLELEA